MVLTDDIIIPPDSELTVPEINVSSHVMRAAGTFLGNYCDEKCKEYMLCKTEERDPRSCIAEGKEVTACGMEFFKKLKKSCADEVTAFAKCLDWYSYDMNPEYCRREQAIYDDCMFRKLGQAKPEFGKFAQIRIHQSARPKPAPFVPEFPGRTPGLPDDYPKQKTVGGDRDTMFG